MRASPFGAGQPALGVPLSFTEDQLNASTQLSLDDITADVPCDDPGGLQRLGETIEFNSLLLQLLRFRGWEVETTPAFAGEGVLVIARQEPFEVRRTGASVADVATEIFKEASMLSGALAHA